MKANVLVKPTRPVEHVYTEVMLGHLITIAIKKDGLG